MARGRQSEPPAQNGPGAGEGAEGAPAPANGSSSGEDSIESLKAYLAEERTRSDGYLVQWQRAAADYQNYKRRTEQEREEYGLLANRALIINILPAVDDLDRALAGLDEATAGAAWVEGFRAIQRKLKGALEASGVSEIHAAGERFDPNIHEAISQAPGEHDNVVSEVRRGYRLGSRVLRPALVVVGNGESA